MAGSFQAPGAPTPATAQRLSVSNFPTPRVWLAAILVLCIAVRVAHLMSVYPTPQFAFHRTWGNSDMYLFDQWAQRIVGGDILGRQLYHPVLDWMLRAAPAEKWTQWFGDAPTYLKAPFYAYLLALLRWLFGDAMLPVALLQILASTFCVILLFAITAHIFDETAGLFAAFLFAVYAPAIHYDVVMLRGPWIALLSLLTTWQLIRLHPAPTYLAVGVLGLAAGLALLVNEGFLFLPPLLLALLALWVRDITRMVRLGGVFLVGLATALSPIVTRNLIVGAPPLQIAITGAPMVAMMNASDAAPLFLRAPPPSFLQLMEQSGGRLTKLVWLCLATFRSWSDLFSFYAHRAVGLVAPFEIPDNCNFYYAAFKDPLLGMLPTYAVLVPLGVVGLALASANWKSIHVLLPVSLAILVSIMTTLPLSRYRVPLALFVFPFAGMAVARAIEWLRAGQFSKTCVAVGGGVLVFVAATLLQRWVIFPVEPPNFYVYRAAEFNEAARVYSGTQRYREASQELLDLARLNPVPAVQADALRRAARLQVQAGDREAARESLQTLTRLGVNDVRMLIAIGDIYWQSLGDAGSALAAYRNASQLHPSGPLAATLGARLSRLETSPEGR